MMKLFLGALGAFILLTANAFAGDKSITADEAQRFVDSLPALDALGDTLEAEGKMDELEINATPVAGEEFKPYSQAVVGLKEKYPGDYAKLNDAVKPHGFSADEWGGVGDRVIVAYLALKMAEENPGAMAQMQAMDKSMLDQMPPEIKAQFQQAMAMMQTIENASPEDKAAVETVKDQLDEYMEEQSQS